MGGVGQVPSWRSSILVGSSAESLLVVVMFVGVGVEVVRCARVRRVISRVRMVPMLKAGDGIVVDDDNESRRLGDVIDGGWL